MASNNQDRQVRNSEVELSSFYVSSSADDDKQDQEVPKNYTECYSNNETHFRKEDKLRTKKTPWQRFKDTFKRVEVPDLDPSLTEAERSYLLATHSNLKRRLYGRHLQMIAIGGSIGSGLFVGSGTALKNGGPASVLLSWLLSGSMMYCTVQALGELAVTYPVSGAFVQYSSRFISPAWGFAMAWNYTIAWTLYLPLELVAASITIKFWDESINPAAWVSIFYALIVIINIFGVRGFAESEFVLSSIKVLAIIGFIILGIVLNCGGGPKGDGYIGGRYWHDPGAFNHGFRGFCSVFPLSAISFTGTELIGLTAAETQNPRKTLPSAIKQVFWRIVLFYILSLLLVGLLVPYTDHRLLSSSSVDASASPFVIAIKNGGINGLPSVMNAVIMISVVSVGNSAVFASSRSMMSLSQQGFGPKILMYVDREGRPLVGVIICLVVGLLGYLAVIPQQNKVFTWLLASSGLSSVVTWGCICISHLRFRYVLKLRGRGPNELPFAAQLGIYGSIYGAVMACVVLVVEFWVALFPINKKGANAESFFQTWLYIPMMVCLCAIYMIWKRDCRLLIKLREIDIDTGRGPIDLRMLRDEVAEEREYIAQCPWYYRVYKFWC
ncbi:unnamed protein product [Ambrosiozyma monospora]|uniref:Unnamed protein product n=1 Tax=Ambrosiozyma monospora TaxID=43982 RepID=A0ACB5SXP9_AMBMO|nr:unnamed protein product [Ambrosiozyma monospora]